MKCFGQMGDTNQVSKVDNVLTEALRRELDDEKAEPMPETTAIFRESGLGRQL